MNSDKRFTKLAVASIAATVPLMTSPQSKLTYIFCKMLVHKWGQPKTVDRCFYHILYNRSRSRAVNTAYMERNWLSGFRFLVRKEIFLFSEKSRLALGPT